MTEYEVVRKLQRKHFAEFIRCPICNTTINQMDIDQLNIGYVKSKINEVFFHNSCYRRKFIKEIK